MTTPTTGSAVDVLLPCPFCGEPPIAQWNAVGVPGMEDCGYYGIDCCHAYSHADDEETAITAWNTRAALRSAGAQ